MSNTSIIMVSYHTGPSLWLAIESALFQPECRELIVINNGSIAGDEERLRRLAAEKPRLKLIMGQGNVGFAKGCNLGAAQAKGDYLLLINPDCIMQEGGLGTALSILKNYPEKTLAGCYLCNPDGSEQRGGRRELMTPGNAIAEGLGLHRFFKGSRRFNLNDTPMPAATHEVPAISGAFMLLARSFYQSLGGHDDGYFLHMDDMDLCYRVHKAGGKVICMPEVRVLHFLSTSEVPNSFVERQKARGFIRYMRKHFSNEHGALFFAALSAGIWLRYATKMIVCLLDRVFVPPLAAKQDIARLVLLYRFTLYAPYDNSWAGRTIIVTGATGQVGLCIVGKALARGARVVAVYHKTRIPYVHPNLSWVQCDLKKLTFELDDTRADTLIHAGSIWLLPSVLPKLFDKGIKRVVAFSSTSVLGKATSTNAHEKDVVQKLETAESDLMRLAGEHKRDATILRPTMIYGVGLDGNVTRLADIVRRFGRLPVYMPAKGFRHPVQAPDLADAALAIVDNPATHNKIYNLGGGESLTYMNMVKRIFAYIGKKPRIIPLPFLPALLDALGAVYQVSNVNGEMARRMNRDLLFDIQDAMDDFDYRPHGFLEGEVVI